MPKIKYDITGSDPEKAIKGFELPKPGVYLCKIDEVGDKPSKGGNPMLTLTYKIVKGDHKNFTVNDYVVLTEAASWKLDQVLQAVGIASKTKGRKGTLDTDKLLGKLVKVTLANESFERDDGTEGTSVRVSLVLANDNDDEDLDGDDEGLEGDDPEPEEEPEEETETSEGDADLYSEEDLEECEVDDLLELFEEEGYDVPDDLPKIKSKKKAALIEAFLEAQSGGGEPEDPEGDDGDDSDDGDDGYDEMSLADLRKECSSRDLNSRGAKPALVARLRENDAENEEEPF